MDTNEIKRLFRKMDIDTEEKRKEITKYYDKDLFIVEAIEVPDENLVQFTAINTCGENDYGELE